MPGVPGGELHGLVVVVGSGLHGIDARPPSIAPTSLGMVCGEVLSWLPAAGQGLVPGRWLVHATSSGCGNAPRGAAG